MLTFRAYPNGVTMGSGNPAPTGGIRGQITGWTPAAVKRHKKWLYSVRPADLSGVGWAVTLTVREIPPSSKEWSSSVERLTLALRRDPSISRWHWVVEWQQRGAPHLHLAVYGDATTPSRVVSAWLRVAAEFEPEPWGQKFEPISGAVGWLKYLSKHASRGVHHYQRWGRPPGWTTTGRLWGKSTTWPCSLPVHGQMDGETFYRTRRWLRGYLVSEARAKGDWRRVGYLRRMHKRPLGDLRGVSEWVPDAVVLRMLESAGWDGTLHKPPRGYLLPSQT